MDSVIEVVVGSAIEVGVGSVIEVAVGSVIEVAVVEVEYPLVVNRPEKLPNSTKWIGHFTSLS